MSTSTIAEPMTVAKFTCSRVTKLNAGTPYESEQVQLHAVSDAGGSNKSWAKATPAGFLQMQIDNPDAQGKFQEGKNYLIHFTPTD